MKDIRKENPEMSTKEMEQMVSAVGVQLCQAVDGLHRNGLIHRDIKPKNIFVDKAGHYVKLGDFGLARALEGTEVEVPLTKEESDELEKIPSKERKHINKIITKLGSTPGTVSYMPPEAFVGAAPNKGFDLYAIGGVLYTLRTGKIPIRSSGEVTNRVNMVMDRVFSDVPPIHKQLGGAYEPSFLDDIIMTLLERKPEDRKHVTIDGKDYSLESAKDISNTIQELAGKHGVSTESFWSEIE
jgi:serine/threonine protein kinase